MLIHHKTNPISLNSRSKDYSEEFRDIIGVKTKKAAITENGITLVNQQKFDTELPVN